MSSTETFVNKVTESGIVTIDLEKFINTTDIADFDLQAYLFMGLILKEKDFRQALKEKDFTPYANKHIALHCSADAIIPMWAYMLATIYLQPVAATIHFANPTQVQQQILLQAINNLPTTPYNAQRVVVKGCGEQPIPEAAYIAITQKLLPVAKSIMYGEPCSTVPIYKNKAQ
jgi:hypothetical protein